MTRRRGGLLTHSQMPVEISIILAFYVLVCLKYI
jgi:hypothetical protein